MLEDSQLQDRLSCGSSQKKYRQWYPAMGYQQWVLGSLPVLFGARPHHYSEIPKSLFQDGERNWVLKVRQNCNAPTVRPSIGAEAQRRRRCGLD